jgi:hypothetical protein
VGAVRDSAHDMRGNGMTAVDAAYGWAALPVAGDSPSSSRPPAMTDEQILEKLFALNQTRAGKQ